MWNRTCKDVTYSSICQLLLRPFTYVQVVHCFTWHYAVLMSKCTYQMCLWTAYGDRILPSICFQCFIRVLPKLGHSNLVDWPCKYCLSSVRIIFLMDSVLSYRRCLCSDHVLCLLPSMANWYCFNYVRRVAYVFSERELKFMFAICHRPSVCRLSVVCLSVVCRL